jgi:hypothetical protein
MRLALDILEGQNFARKTSTASDHVAPVQRRLPPSMRSTATDDPGAPMAAALMMLRRIQPPAQ